MFLLRLLITILLLPIMIILCHVPFLFHALNSTSCSKLAFILGFLVFLCSSFNSLLVIRVLLNEGFNIGLLHLTDVELCLVCEGINGLNRLVMQQVWTLPLPAIPNVDISTSEGDQLF